MSKLSRTGDQLHDWWYFSNSWGATYLKVLLVVGGIALLVSLGFLFYALGPLFFAPFMVLLGAAFVTTVIKSDLFY